MILIPELQLVVILVPRTGTGSLRRAIAEKYPRSMLLYRHMEADGVPAGYDRWPKVGVVRDPVARLWSMYKYLQRVDGPYPPLWIDAQRASVLMPFSEWLVKNRLPFTGPYEYMGNTRFEPRYSIRHHMPENLKSQFIYLRPDLGTHIYRYDAQGLNALYQRLGVSVERTTNVTAETPAPELSQDAKYHIARFFAWDLQQLTKEFE